MRLIEPLSLVFGREARRLIAAGLALPLGDGGAFLAARLIDGDRTRLVQATALPAGWEEPLRRLATSLPWAGLPARPHAMGILNATPDSFSDGGSASIAHGLAMIAAGASVIDIGGESTRPGAAEVGGAEQLDRVMPLILGLRGQGALLSIDTRSAMVMRAALAAGVTIVNDVSALAHDPAAATTATAAAGVVLMHMRGTPTTMASHAHYDEDPAVAVTCELAARIAAAEHSGIARDRIMIDPGLGFAKTAEHSAAVLRRLGLLANLGCPVLVGASRKGFVGALTQVGAPAARLGGSIAAALAGVRAGARMVRVHDVAETVQALRLWEAMRA